MRHLTYSCADLDEQLLVFGPESAKTRILIVPPLFDEMNRMRSTLVEAMRNLAGAGIASALPDLPGCNESLAKLEDQNIGVGGWQEAVSEAAETWGASHVFSVRGGALIDDLHGLPMARLVPAKGKTLLTMLIRTRIAGDKESGITISAEELRKQAENGSVDLAGHNISALMWDELEKAEIAPGNDVQLLKPADVGGSALWLRAEPQHDSAMGAGLAEWLATWSAAS